MLCEGVLNTGTTMGTPVAYQGSSPEVPPAARGCPLDPGCRGTLGLSEHNRAGKDGPRYCPPPPPLVNVLAAMPINAPSSKFRWQKAAIASGHVYCNSR
ncbi:hypothetical protein VT03_27070 [Planctomyces sp. SH-PL14]|nr:hypothetical protein VT03_27070 [Planctomyces sp. SH-PL14]